MERQTHDHLASLGITPGERGVLERRVAELPTQQQGLYLAELGGMTAAEVREEVRRLAGKQGNMSVVGVPIDG